MNKNRTKARFTALFEKKFAIYSVAGTAALMIPSAAKASIVYVGNVDHNVGFQGSYSFEDISIFTNFYTATQKSQRLPATALRF